MKYLFPLLLAILAGCTQSEESIVLSFGATSKGYAEVREGTTDSFAVGGPGPDEPFGHVTISTDGKVIDTFEWGGSMRVLGPARNPPKEVRFRGETTSITYFGISRLDTDFNGTLLKKGHIEAGEFDFILRWHSENETYEANKSAQAIP